MWHYFPRGPLENRVLKTRFIIQKNFKNLPSPKHGFTSPDRIRLERESDQREGDQIREREKESDQRGRERDRVGCATWVRATQIVFFSHSGFDFFFGWCCFGIYEL